MTTAEKCKVFVEDIKAYWDYTLITNYGWVLLIKDDYLRASIGEAILKGVDDKIITRLTKLYVLIEGHDDLINLFTENQNFALEVIEHLLQKGFSFTVGSMLTDSRRVKDLYYVYSMAKYLDLHNSGSQLQIIEVNERIAQIEQYLFLYSRMSTMVHLLVAG